MDLSIKDVTDFVSMCLKDVPQEDIEKINAQIEKNKIDGKAFLCTKKSFSMFQCSFTDIPTGYLFRLFEALNKKFEDDNDSCDDTASLSDSPDVSSSSLSEVSSGSPSPSEKVPPLTRPLPKMFPLYKCQFGYSAKDMIKSGQISCSGKREITSELVRVMKCYESRPSRHLKSMAVDAFIHQYQSACLGQSPTDAKTFWYKKISDKLNAQAKKQRRLLDEPKSKRGYNNLSGIADTSLKRRKVQSLNPIADLHDEKFYDEAKEVLANELKKSASVRNKKIIAEKMEVTFSIRRNYILENNPSQMDLIKMWPALSTFDELVREFERVQHFPNEAILVDVGKDLFHKIIKCCFQKNPKSATMKKILNYLPVDYDESCFNDVHIMVGLLLLCVLLKGNTKREFSRERYLLDLCPENTTFGDTREAFGDRQQPILVVYGNIASPQRITVFAEKAPVLNVESIMKGIIALFGMYYIMNYQYCPHVAKVLQFLQLYLLRIPESVIYDSVKELKLQLDNLH